MVNNALFFSIKYNLILFTRQVGTKRDYVTMLVEGMKILDEVVKDVPEAIDQYIHYSRYAFNVALKLFKCDQVDDATILSRLSCEAGSKWYHLKSDDGNAINKVGKNVFIITCACLKLCRLKTGLNRAVRKFSKRNTYIRWLN